MKINLVACFHPQMYGESLAQGFEELGHTVNRISVDTEDSSLSGKFDVHVMTEEYKKDPRNKNLMDIQNKLKEVILDPYLDYNADLTFIVQSQIIPRMNYKTSIYYYQTEWLRPQLPKGYPIKGLFYAYLGGNGQIKNALPIEYNQLHFTKFLPYGVNPQYYSECLPLYQNRSVFIGFMGNCGFNPESKDLDERFIHVSRQLIFEHLKDLCIGFEDRGEAHSFQDYVQYMQKAKVAINIPGNWGNVNNRQFEALACGCVLLQWRYQELIELGYKDYKNCLLFSSLKELDLKIQWIQQQSDIVLQDIQQAGLNLYKRLQCSWQERAKIIMKRICEYTERELGFIPNPLPWMVKVDA